jgi:hypothetical protein
MVSLEPSARIGPRAGGCRRLQVLDGFQVAAELRFRQRPNKSESGGGIIFAAAERRFCGLAGGGVGLGQLAGSGKHDPESSLRRPCPRSLPILCLGTLPLRFRFFRILARSRSVIANRSTPSRAEAAMFTRHTYVPNCAGDAETGKLRPCESAEKSVRSYCAEMFAGGSAL